MRNWTEGFMDGVEGKRELSELGFRRDGNEVF